MIESTSWNLYILRCQDGSLYTGITTDVQRRYEMHQKGTGAKYTKSHPPVEIVYQEFCGSHSQALKREWEVKKLSREQKLNLIAKKTE